MDKQPLLIEKASEKCQKIFPIVFPIILFVLIRVIIFLSSNYEGLLGYGDVLHFFDLAGLKGLPFINYWVEFPPIFPYLIKLLYWISNGQQHVFVYGLFIIFLICDVINLYLFIHISRYLADHDWKQRFWFYGGTLVGLAYCWWYFDGIAVMLMLLSVDLILTSKSNMRVGIIIALGILTKLFPLLVLPVVWRYRKWNSALKITITAIGFVLIIYGTLFSLSPDFTKASILSQLNKGSWETVWALIDGNYHTGNFGAIAERYVAQSAYLPEGNLPVVNTKITLAIFGFVGLIILVKSHVKSNMNMMHLLGVSWTVFLLWSPGWSPQWILYLLPIVLLGLPTMDGILVAGLLVLVNLLEWPVLLSRGYFWGLWITIPIRTLIFILAGILFAQPLFKPLNLELGDYHG